MTPTYKHGNTVQFYVEHSTSNQLLFAKISPTFVACHNSNKNLCQLCVVKRLFRSEKHSPTRSRNFRTYLEPECSAVFSRAFQWTLSRDVSSFTVEFSYSHRNPVISSCGLVWFYERQCIFSGFVFQQFLDH